MNNGNIQKMTECSVMIALATVLSLFKIAEMPYGGSITVASMLPIVVAVFRNGGKWGLGTALVASAIQLLLGLKNFSYFTTWQSIVALGVFDYILAFGAFALAGVFRRVEKRQNLAMLYGAMLASILRYICHVISGATIWAGLSIPTEAALIYSIGYNATYMIPETIVLLLSTVYVASVIDFKRRTPSRMPTLALDKLEAYSYIGAGLAILVALIMDVAEIFPHIQNPESGEFDIRGVQNANMTYVAIVSAVALVIAAGLVAFALLRRKNTKADNA